MNLRRENLEGLGAALRNDRRRLLFGALAVLGVIGATLWIFSLTDHDTKVEISYKADESAEPVVWTIDCANEDPEQNYACEFLANTDLGVFGSAAAPGPCTEIYGGPETAQVSGEVRGDNVNITYSRTDGCRIMRFNQVVILFETMPGGLPESDREIADPVGGVG